MPAFPVPHQAVFWSVTGLNRLSSRPILVRTAMFKARKALRTPFDCGIDKRSLTSSREIGVGTAWWAPLDCGIDDGSLTSSQEIGLGTAWWAPLDCAIDEGSLTSSQAIELGTAWWAPLDCGTDEGSLTSSQAITLANTWWVPFDWGIDDGSLRSSQEIERSMLGGSDQCRMPSRNIRRACSERSVGRRTADR
jgi:hypothetical protein